MDSLTIQLRQFTFVWGFSLAFGSLFAKTWRVHVIMITSMKTAKSKVIRDQTLVLFVVVLIMVNTLILVLWNVIDPMSAHTLNVSTKPSDDDPSIVYLYQLPICQSDKQLYFTAVLIVIQGLLLIFGTFLAWETRQVKVAALNDSKYIGMCIYNVVVLAIMGVAINYLVDSSVNISYGFMSCFLIAGTTLTQTIIFFPKVLAVHANRNSVEPQSAATDASAHVSTFKTTEMDK